MKIAFAGSSGTGKTYLAVQLAAEFGLPINPIGSRQVARRMGFGSPYDCDRAGQRARFQSELLRSKLEWERSQPAFVTDRTTVDNLTYTVLHEVACIDDAMAADVQAGLAQYTHVIVCLRAGFHRIGNDPARVASPIYHDLYESCLLGLLERYRGPHTRVRQLVASDPQQRLRVCREFVTEQK